MNEQTQPPTPRRTVVNMDNLGVVLMAAIAFGIGCTITIFSSSDWYTALLSTVTGTEPTAFWYVSRSAAFVAYVLLWLSMVLGLSITNKLARLWPGGPAVVDLHQYSSLLGLAFGCIHALILLGDHYIGYTIGQILLPFNSLSYHPISVGLGQCALYLGIVVALSFYVRQYIGYRSWRLLHYASFAVFALVLFHGLFSGTDSSALWARLLYGTSGLSVIGLTVYRIRWHTRKPATRPVTV